MTPLSLLWHYLWIAPNVLLVPLAILLVRRGLHRQFPIFFTYIVYSFVEFAVLFTIDKLPWTTGWQYTIAYSFGIAIDTALQLGIIYEICAHLFRNYSVLGHFGKPLFRWITVTLLLAGLVLAVSFGAHNALRLLSILYVLQRTASMSECGLVVGMFLLSSYLGLSWRSYIFGIALGLGFMASADLAVTALRAETGFAYTKLIDCFELGVFHCCVLIWGCYLWAPERSSQYTLKALPEADLESWNQELQRLLNR